MNGHAAVGKTSAIYMYLTIRPVALSGYGSIAREAEPWRAKGVIVLVSPN